MIDNSNERTQHVRLWCGRKKSSTDMMTAESMQQKDSRPDNPPKNYGSSTGPSLVLAKQPPHTFIFTIINHPSSSKEGSEHHHHSSQSRQEGVYNCFCF
jgi:hypothetical protein